MRINRTKSRATSTEPVTMSHLDEYFQRLLHGPPFKDGEEMKFEALRLASFDSWPIWAEKRPGCLAGNGFYYSGCLDRVKCFACHGEIAKWSSKDDVAEKHRNLFPDCPFVRQCADGNKTMQEVCSDGVPLKSKDQSNRLPEAEELLKQMASFSGKHSANPSNSTNSEIPNPESTTAKQTPHATGFDPEQMKDEYQRLQTFNGRWPHGSSVSTEKLAKAGFYYCGPGDRVKCAFCKGCLEAWKPTDDPIDEHKKSYTTCSFINRISDSNTLESVESTNKGDQPKKKPTPEQFGVICEKPKYPQYVTEFSRLDTFQMWPKKAIINPLELVKAGFFYVGYADDVKCFFCGGAIRCWEAGADPWQLHAQWFSKCGFLKLNRGEEYINGVLGQYSINQQHSQGAVSGVNNHQTRQNVLASVNGKEMDKSNDASIELQAKASANKSENTNRQHKRKNKKRKNKKSGDDSETVTDCPSPTEEIDDEEIIRLQEEYKRIQRERLCKICMDDNCNVAFLPCGHIVSCPRCASALRNCPVCRTVIKGSVRVFFP